MPDNKPVLLISGDDATIQAVRAASTAAGVNIYDTALAHGSLVDNLWSYASRVLVGVDAIEAVIAAAWPARRGVTVVGWRTAHQPGDQHLFVKAEKLGSDHVVLLPAAFEWLADNIGTPVPEPTALDGREFTISWTEASQFTITVPADEFARLLGRRSVAALANEIADHGENLDLLDLRDLADTIAEKGDDAELTSVERDGFYITLTPED